MPNRFVSCLASSLSSFKHDVKDMNPVGLTFPFTICELLLKWEDWASLLELDDCENLGGKKSKLVLRRSLLGFLVLTFFFMTSFSDLFSFFFNSFSLGTSALILFLLDLGSLDLLANGDCCKILLAPHQLIDYITPSRGDPALWGVRRDIRTKNGGLL